MTTERYIGRFAPSPSGPLHAGSLIAALASYLDAKANNGLWLLRIEDLDPPRETPQATANILFTLEQLGLQWDGEVLYQSRQHHAYEQAIALLAKQGLVFPCTCSRQEIRENSGIYPGSCRDKSLTNMAQKYPQQKNESFMPYALRCRIGNTPNSNNFHFTDLFQGQQSQNLGDHGDFIIKRKDGFYAYQLAVIIDDAQQNITHIIRGNDLLGSTGRQLFLQNKLGLPTPCYGHIPVIVNTLGQKLSKQHFAAAIDLKVPVKTVIQALSYLQQEPEPGLLQCHLDDVLAWAVQHWQPSKLKGLQQLPEHLY